MASSRLRYIESDGQVYLVRRNGKLTFPAASEPLPFEATERHSARFGDVEVTFCRPRLSAFPSEWVFKDALPGMPDVDPIVQRAVNASLARCVVGVVCVRPDGRILMVKSNRGFTKGMWNIPGGFIEYGEHPEEAAPRELREETGVEIRLGRLLGVYKERFESPYFMYGFMYEATPVQDAIRIDESEIEAAEWMEPQRAHDETRNPFAKAAFRERFEINAAGRSKRP